jgi:hypothetical protein
MDTSPGRTRAQITEAEDFLPGGNHYDQRTGGSREGGIPKGPVQKDGTRKVLTCFNCRKPSHFAQDCQQKKWGNQGFPHNNQGPPRVQQNHQEEEGDTNTIRRIVDDRDPQHRATDWLSGVANKHDNVKDIIMQELMGREDFQNA